MSTGKVRISTGPEMPAKPPSGEEFRDRLRKHVRARYPTDAAAARAIGVDKGTLSKWMSGERPRPQQHSLRKIADALHVSIDDLIGYEPMPEAGVVRPDELIPIVERLKAALADASAAFADLAELLERDE